MSGDERCQRCDEADPDLRTLWMACLYDMQELSVPFKQVQVRGTYAEKVGTKKLERFGITVPVFEAKEDASAHPYHYFTLRVCKECRADWMRALKTWFYLDNRPPPTGTGVYVRDKGVSREATEAEVREMRRRQSEGN